MQRRFARRLAGVGLAALLVLGLAAMPAADDRPRFSEWSTPVNLGPIVNSPATEAGPFISKDGLSLYFAAWTCGESPVPPCLPDGLGGFDIYVSQRTTVGAVWGPPKNLGPLVNTSSNDQTPAVSMDGHRLVFASNRPGTLGGLDLYVSRRRDKRDDFGWQDPVNLGDAINTLYVERGPSLFEDVGAGAVTLYFSSTRPGGVGSEDIYASVLLADGSFAPAVLVPELCSTTGDMTPFVRRDGLEVFFCSPRPPQLGGGTDLWVSTRASTLEPWSEPENLGAVVNSPELDFRPAISSEGTALYFHSERAGGFGGYDLYVTTRTRIKGRR